MRTNDGREVPLAAIATWEYAPGVTGLDRRQRMSSILVTADLTNAEARADIMRTMSLRPDFMLAINEASRLHFRDGALTRAQHEMIAAYVSALNRCHY